MLIDSYLASPSGKENTPTAQNEKQGHPPVIPQKVMDMLAKLTGWQLSMLAAHMMEESGSANSSVHFTKVLPKVLP